MRTEDLRGLNFRHLHYFWVVAKESHLTRAAERLHVSQSAVSTQLRQLETALGHDLFEREGRTLRLTEAGSIVLGYAESIFDLGAELLATVRGRESGTPDLLRVGAVATLSRNFQQNLLKPLLTHEDGHADVQLVLESASLDELLDRLRVHKLDLVLSNRPTVPGVNRSVECRRIARQSVSFYRKLGIRQIVDNPPRYARFETPGGTTFSIHNVGSESRAADVIVYFEVDDVDATVRQLQDDGIEFDTEPADQEWLWREAYLRDPAGNTLCIYHAGRNRRHPPWRIEG